MKKREYSQVLIADETKFELFKLKPLAPKRRLRKSYEDVIVFLLEEYKKTKKTH